jgi:hypothetical protein
MYMIYPVILSKAFYLRCITCSKHSTQSSLLAW